MLSIFSGVAVETEIEQHLHHLGVRAAVERSLQRRDAGHDRGVHIRERGGRHARRERRRVQLVIGVEHERHVERARGERVGRGP